tara:strand:- start:914 stop:1477 length:564 start_codon:yes stop_codon:yes gene_type:complete
MNLKKIIIHDYEILFDILEEIKEKFNLELVKIDKKNFNEKIKKISTQYLIISKYELAGYKNHLVLDKIPIKIDRLIQLINLKFLKDTFNFQSDISVGQYKLNFNSREISKNHKIIDLTEREINLIFFLKEKARAVKIDELQKEVWAYNPKLETHTVETHIYRLRKKIKDEFGDENFILSSKRGYYIN